MWLWNYAVAVLSGWWGLAALLLAVSEASDKLFGISSKWLHEARRRAVVVLLLAASAFVYKDQSSQVESLTKGRQQSQFPIVAENPDHAGLVDRVEKAAERIRALERELAQQAIAQRDAEQQVRNLTQKLAATEKRSVACDTLAGLSARGRDLVTKLLATRAAPETRKEIDRWYGAVCAAMTGPQCEAFRSAPRKSDVWVGYPVEDEGYSQTLRGRTEYLSTQLARLCS